MQVPIDLIPWLIGMVALMVASHVRLEARVSALERRLLDELNKEKKKKCDASSSPD